MTMGWVGAKGVLPVLAPIPETHSPPGPEMLNVGVGGLRLPKVLKNVI
jgi:hypothetical protein